MRLPSTPLLPLTSFLTTLCSCILLSQALGEPWKYPEAQRGTLVEEIHGVKVPDPYRWLENIDSTDTKTFVQAQAKFTEGYLADLPDRKPMREALKKLWAYDRLGLPVSEAGRVFFSRRSGLQNQGVLYWKASAEASEKVLLDPNQLSQDGTVALANWSVSKDGKKLVYGLSKSGSDWVEIRFLDIETGESLPDVLQWVKFSRASWNKDGTGVYYSRFAAPAPGDQLKAVNVNQKVYFHRLGEDQEKDTLIHERPDSPKMKFGAWESDDGQFLLLSGSLSTDPKNGVWYRKLPFEGKTAFQPIFDQFDADYRFVGKLGPTLYFVTDHEAPNGKLIAVPWATPQPEHWKILIPEEKFPLSSVSLLDGKFLVTRLVDAADKVTVHDTEGKQVGEVPVPPLSSVRGFGGRQHAKETHYYVSGFATPGQIYRYDLPSGKSTLVSEIKPPCDVSQYSVEQHFVASKDGTKVPVFVFQKKGRKKDSSGPVLLYGYGGFDQAMTPAFSPSNIAWADAGGAYCVACLRGGGEYGRQWHDDGRLLKKHNVFDDFASVARWLMSEGYAGPGQVGINGGSNGGLLTAACALREPELYGAVLSAVGVHDMLRFHKFTIGYAWQDEYGHIDKPEHFKNLLSYSPVHLAEKATKLPPTLILTGDHDDRVFPAHSFKLAAALQHTLPSGNPVLLRVDVKAGHGAGKPTSKQIDETADEFAFLLKHLKR